MGERKELQLSTSILLPGEALHSSETKRSGHNTASLLYPIPPPFFNIWRILQLIASVSCPGCKAQEHRRVLHVGITSPISHLCCQVGQIKICQKPGEASIKSFNQPHDQPWWDLPTCSFLPKERPEQHCLSTLSNSRGSWFSIYYLITFSICKSPRAIWAYRSVPVLHNSFVMRS